MSRFGLSEATIEKIQGVLARFPQVERAILYGSRAKGNYKSGSDIDLALVGGEDLDLVVLLRVMCAIEDLLLPYKVGLCILHWIEDSEVLDHIRRVGLFFYQRQGMVCPDKV